MAAAAKEEEKAVTFDEHGNKVPFNPDEAPGGRLAPVREFKTAGYSDGGADDGADERVELPFVINGHKLLAYLPTSTQVGMAARGGSRTARVADKIDIFMRFLDQCLDRASYAYIETRLEDPDDKEFGFKAIGEIALWLIEEYDKAHPEKKKKSNNGPRTTRRRG